MPIKASTKKKDASDFDDIVKTEIGNIYEVGLYRLYIIYVYIVCIYCGYNICIDNILGN